MNESAKTMKYVITAIWYLSNSSFLIIVITNAAIENMSHTNKINVLIDKYLEMILFIFISKLYFNL